VVLNTELGILLQAIPIQTDTVTLSDSRCTDTSTPLVATPRSPHDQRSFRLLIWRHSGTYVGIGSEQFCRLEKLLYKILNCPFHRLLRALIGGQTNERVSSGNVINSFAEATCLYNPPSLYPIRSSHSVVVRVRPAGLQLPIHSTNRIHEVTDAL
jgi:hypothetical protein